MSYRSELLCILHERGYISRCTNIEDLDLLLNKGRVTGYVGFDCTAASLHVGNLMQIMLIRWWQKCGHKPLILMGGGTTYIGDPSGKDASRKLLSSDTIEANKKAIRMNFTPFIEIAPEYTSIDNKAFMVDNLDWLISLRYLDFLRDYGKHFSVNRMLSFDSVKLRLEKQGHMSFLEFNYMLLQAYDFLELYNSYGCMVQFGGTEQWGNIVNGIDLARKVCGVDLFGVTTPLITKSDGSKMGKSVSGAIWLDPTKCSPYEYWQFWRNTHDRDVEKFLKLYTELPIAEISKLAQLQGAEMNEAKIILANEATALCYGRDVMQNICEASADLFDKSSTTTHMATKESREGLPVYSISKDELMDGIPAYKMFVITGLCTSGNAAKTLINNASAKIDDVVVTDALQRVTLSWFNEQGRVVKLAAGKKRYAFVQAV